MIKLNARIDDDLRPRCRKYKWEDGVDICSTMQKKLAKAINGRDKGMMNFRPGEVQKFQRELKKIVDRYNKDPKVRKRIEEGTGHDDLGTVKFVPMKCEIWDQDPREVTFVVCDEDQEYRLRVPVDDMADDLQNALNDDTLECGYGDGDEGIVSVRRIKPVMS